MNGFNAHEGANTVLAAFGREHGEQLRLTFCREQSDASVVFQHWYRERGIYRPRFRGITLRGEEVKLASRALTAAIALFESPT